MRHRLDDPILDNVAQRGMALYKAQFKTLIDSIEAWDPPSTAQSMALSRLEEAYMWVGKAMLQDQFRRDAIARGDK